MRNQVKVVLAAADPARGHAPPYCVRGSITSTKRSIALTAMPATIEARQRAGLASPKRAARSCWPTKRYQVAHASVVLAYAKRRSGPRGSIPAESTRHGSGARISLFW